ncbi:HNH endonuclease [Listeria cornellensis]
MVAIKGRGRVYPKSTVNKVQSDLRIKEYGEPIVIKRSINTWLIRSYVRDVEQQTGRKLANNQVDMLKNALRAKEYNKLTPDETKVHRRSFNKVKNSLINEWELKTGQVWPTYSDDIISVKNGSVIRNKGELYDAHHLIENNFGGEHEWWNIHPAKFPNEHQAGIHGAGSPGNALFKGVKK